MGALAGQILMFKSRALTGCDGQRVWKALMENIEVDGDIILGKAMSKFMYLKLEDVKYPDSIFRRG